MPTLDELLAQMQTSAEESRLANIKRQQQVEAIFDEIIARYGPGGTYGAAAEALLEKRKVGDVGAGAQRLISSGLYGTEVGGGLERAWEAEVGAPARLQLEDIKMQRLSEAQLGKASFMERIEEPYPDYGLLSQYFAQAGAQPTGGGYGGGGAVSDMTAGWGQPSAPKEGYTGTYGYRGTEYGEEPMGWADIFGPGTTMYGYGQGGGGVTDADTAAWQQWEAERKAQYGTKYPAYWYKGPAYPSAAAWKKDIGGGGGFAGGGGGTFGGYGYTGAY